MSYDLSKQSAELTAFYVAYAEWAAAGAPAGAGFDARRGLCTNCLLRYSPETEEEMYNQFLEATTSPVYPFGSRAFDSCLADASFHLDPNRIQWVLDHIPAA